MQPMLYNENVYCVVAHGEGTIGSMKIDNFSAELDLGRNVCFIYRRPTLYPLEIAVDFLKSL
jgi:hypothetical protein